MILDSGLGTRLLWLTLTILGVWLVALFLDRSHSLEAAGTSITTLANRPVSVRLRAATGPAPVSIELVGRWQARNPQGQILREGMSFRGRIRAEADGIHLGPWLILADPFFLETLGEDGLRIGTRTYRGRMRVQLQRDEQGRVSGLETRLLLPLEDYVLGVVCGEMPTSAPGGAAALEAVAIAARSWALWKLSGSRDWLRDDSSDQHFESVDFETQSARDAVAHTRGRVLAHEGTLLPAWYHADCGGTTANATEAGFLQGPLPPLIAVTDPGCERSRLWLHTISAPRLDAIAEARGLGTFLEGFQFLQRDAAGRLLRTRLDGELHRIVLPGETLRHALGAPSTVFLSLQPQRDGSLFIRGRGRGHGVGLCQEGALRRSSAGATADEILATYYPSAQVQPHTLVSLH